MAKKPKKQNSGGNAVIYARYSSASQRDVSIEQQITACEEFAQRGGYTIVECYPDRAISGRTDNRPQFQRMMRDAHKGGFDFVIAWKSNRMGRNMVQAMTNEMTLANLGIRCLYVEEDFDDTAAGRFALRSMMNVNQFYSENLAEDVIRGMRDNAEKCMVNGPTPFGYKKGEDGRFAIDEKTAPIVSEIFHRFLSGWSITDLMEDLNERGIKTRYGNPWKLQSFQTLLTNDVYTGIYKYGDIRIEGGVPEIIDKKTFGEVQAALANKKRPRGKQRLNADYLLTGKIFCGHCGSHMIAFAGTGKSGRSFRYYACQKRRRDHSCEKKHVPKDQIEKAVCDILRAKLSDSGFIDWVCSGYEKVIEAARAESKLQNLQDELSRVKTELDNIMKAIRAGIINEMTKDAMDELMNSKADLEEAIRLEEMTATAYSVDDVRAWLTDLLSGDLDDPEYMKELVKIFVNAVYVYDDRIKVRFNYGAEEYSNAPMETEDDSGEVFANSQFRRTKGDLGEHLRFHRQFFEVEYPFENGRIVV